MSSWEPPQCIHGYIILGCPHDDCPTQVAYLAWCEARVRDYEMMLTPRDPKPKVADG